MVRDMLIKEERGTRREVCDCGVAVCGGGKGAAGNGPEVFCRMCNIIKAVERL